MNKPEVTAETFRGGWYHSGDIVSYDDDGIFYFVDRKSGFIRVRGENMSSTQVEELLSEPPGIKMSAVFSIHAEEGEEEDIVAYIVREPGYDLTQEALKAWMKLEMPKFMWPKHIRFIDQLPVTPTFKVEKYKLKAEILKELDR